MTNLKMQINVSVSEAMYDAVTKESERTGATRAELIRRAIKRAYMTPVTEKLNDSRLKRVRDLTLAQERGEEIDES